MKACPAFLGGGLRDRTLHVLWEKGFLEGSMWSSEGVVRCYLLFQMVCRADVKLYLILVGYAIVPFDLQAVQPQMLATQSTIVSPVT